MPIKHLISFNKLLEYYDDLAQSEDSYLAAKAKRVLDAQRPYPELRIGFDDYSLLTKYEDVINLILEDSFSEVLSGNEIKTATLPYNDLIFNSSKRFKKIVEDAGPDFEPKIRNQEKDMDYMMTALVVLNFYYGFRLDYHSIDLWKEKIPPGSFISKGFVIANMFDVTAEHAISDIKSALISNRKVQQGGSIMQSLQETFRSFFRLKSIHLSFVDYNERKCSIG